MKNLGLNMKDVRGRNKSAVLYLLNAVGATSRKDIASTLGLTPAAVTKICSELIDEDLICESGEIQCEEAKAGRKKILLSLRLDDKYAFGINAETDSITFSVFSLGGKRMREESIPISSDVDFVFEKGAQFISSSGYQNRLCGMGICIIGSLGENDFGLWKCNNLREKAESKFSLPCEIENNVKAFALAELLFGEASSDENALFFKWGPGIGSAISAQGNVFCGNDSSVTEIGHYIVSPSGKKCRCGRYGCLETVASASAIEDEVGKGSFNEIIQSTDKNTVNIFEEKIDLVSLALTNTATISGTKKIILFGSAFYNPAVSEKLRKQCLRYNSNLKKDNIALSVLNDKIKFIAPAAICAKAYFFEKRRCAHGDYAENNSKIFTNYPAR